MHEQSIILSIPVEDADWLGEADVSSDNPELQLHVKRHWLLPDSVSFQIQTVMLELLAEPSDVEGMRRLLESIGAAKAAVTRKEYYA